MGCSPSKGNNSGTLSSIQKRQMFPPPQESLGQTIEDGQNRTSATTTKKKSVTEFSLDAPDLDKVVCPTLDHSVSQRKEKKNDKLDVTEKKSVRKTKKHARAAKVPQKKDKDNLTEDKVDFPEPLVNAHKAAYAFLKPSINKYDILLGLLEQAAETRFSVQPMVAFMALRYEEIIQGLEEIADEGEKVFKENAEHLAWTSHFKNLSSPPPLKSDYVNVEPPPDLLQQLLQYTTQRMKNVTQSVSGIGDSALEEAVEYFGSVSDLLEEKLKAKHAAETRIIQLLSRIEMAALRKPGPEDSALFSEDSGIGVESESLAGSERNHRRHSSESTGTNGATHVSRMDHTSTNITQTVSKQKLLSQMSPSISLNSLNSTGSLCTIMDNDQRDFLLGSVSFDFGDEDDNIDDDADDEGGIGKFQVGFRKRSNSSPAQQEHPHRLPSKRIENAKNVEMTLKMKNAISGKIQFVAQQNINAKRKLAGSPKTQRSQWTDEEEQSQRRPQTATPARKVPVKKTAVTKQRRSLSAESLRSKGEDPTLLELERTQKDLNQRLQRMGKSKPGVNKRLSLCKQTPGNSPAQCPAIIRKQPSLKQPSNTLKPFKNKADFKCQNEVTRDMDISVMENENPKQKPTYKGPVRATPPQSPPSSPRPSSRLSRGRNSVKKLIDTFSQGIEQHDCPKVLGPLKGVRKCGVPVLPGLGNMQAVLSIGLTSCRPDSNSTVKTDDLDLNSLPPPPLEVLMDKSFEGAQSPQAGTEDDETMGVGKSPVLKRTVVSQKLRTSLQSVTVLPSKRGLPHALKAVSFARSDQKDTSTPLGFGQQDTAMEADPGRENDSSYHQALKMKRINHRINISDSQVENSLSYEKTSPPSGQEQFTGVQDSDMSESLFSADNSQPLPTPPPKSKSRMLPSTPSTPTRSHRRLPSPNPKRQPTPPSSASPPVNRKLPTPPAVHRTVPSPSAAKHNILASYPFKAPSPPASPKLQRWSRENSSEDSSSARMISNAHSVFCPVSSSLFEAKSPSGPRPPQAWIYTGVSFPSYPLGNHSKFQGPRPFIRRSHSDRRPSLNFPPKSPGISVSETCGSEPAIWSQGFENEPTRDDELWGSQSDLRVTPRSASHPDLCVIGQALYKD